MPGEKEEEQENLVPSSTNILGLLLKLKSYNLFAISLTEIDKRENCIIKITIDNHDVSDFITSILIRQVDNLSIFY